MTAAEEEAAIAEMRASGREKEADEAQRVLALERELAKISKLGFNAMTTEALQQAAIRKSEASIPRSGREAQVAATENLMAELKVLEAKNSGNEKAVELAEKELKIRQQTKQLMDQLGLSQKDALEVATKIVDLEKNGSKDSGEKRIQGFSRKANGLRAFAGLAEYDALQVGGEGERIFSAFGQGTDKRFKRGFNASALGLEATTALQSTSRPAATTAGASSGSVVSAIEKLTGVVAEKLSVDDN